MPRILSGTFEHGRHRRSKSQRTSSINKVDSSPFILAFASMTVSSGTSNGLCPSSWGQSCRGDKTKNSFLFSWAMPAVVTPPSTSPSTSYPPSKSISPADSATCLVEMAHTGKNSREEEDEVASFQLEPASKRRRSIFSNVTIEKYMEMPQLLPTPQAMTLQNTTKGGNTSGEEDSWGHFIDVVEEEEKVVRHSRILSRGTSFDPTSGFTL